MPTDPTPAPTPDAVDEYRNLRDDEIAALPLELRVCWFLQPWNHHGARSIKDIDSWASVIGFMAYPDGDDDGSSVAAAINDANRVHAFVLAQLTAARAALKQIAEAQPAQWQDNLHNDVDCDGCDRLIGVAREALAGKDVT